MLAASNIEIVLITFFPRLPDQVCYVEGKRLEEENDTNLKRKQTMRGGQWHQAYC